MGITIHCDICISVPDDKDLFDPTITLSDSWDEELVLCVCQSNNFEVGNQEMREEANCSVKSYNTCDMDELIESKEAKFTCTTTSDLNRRGVEKRSAGGSSVQVIISCLVKYN